MPIGLDTMIVALCVLAALGLLACLTNIVAQAYGRATPAWAHAVGVLMLVLGFWALSSMLTFEHDLTIERSVAIGVIFVGAGTLLNRKALSWIAAHKFASACVLLIVAGAAMLGALFFSMKNAPSSLTLVAIMPIALGFAGLAVSLGGKFRRSSSISEPGDAINSDK